MGKNTLTMAKMNKLVVFNNSKAPLQELDESERKLEQSTKMYNSEKKVIVGTIVYFILAEINDSFVKKLLKKVVEPKTNLITKMVSGSLVFSLAKNEIKENHFCQSAYPLVGDADKQSLEALAITFNKAFEKHSCATCKVLVSNNLLCFKFSLKARK